MTTNIAVAGNLCLSGSTDVVADVLSLPACANQKTAYGVLEALRIAATQGLDMHMEDLQVLVAGHVDRGEVDGLLWDPMPGGSGLLDQICERFEDIVAAAREVVEHCPSVCETSCIDCLQTFRNAVDEGICIYLEASAATCTATQSPLNAISGFGPGCETTGTTSSKSPRVICTTKAR